MRIKQTIKKISALGLGATMVGATIFGAFAQADLAQYPNQYIKDGKFTGVLVVGDSAAAEDVIGVSDIAVSLQFAATVPVAVAGSTVSTSGEAWLVRKGSTNVVEMAENLESSETANRESIATITGQSYIDDAELASLLASGIASNSKGDAPFEQRIYFEDLTAGYVQYLEDRGDITGDFLYFPNGQQIARYELEFTTSLESDVDDSSGSADTTGDYLTDLEDVQFNILGKSFSVVQARRNGGKTGNITLTLMGGAVRDTLNEGSTKTYTIDGSDFEVTLDFVDADSAKFTVNGEGTRDMKDGDTDKLSDGTVIGVSNILYQNYAGGVHNSEFFLGAQKIYIKDTDITDTASSHEYKVDDETIDGGDAWIEGSDDGTTFKMDRLVVNMTADDDIYIPAGGKLSENPEFSEPALLFGQSWDIEYRGLSDEPLEITRIKSAGSDDYELEFVDGSGNTAKIPLMNVVSGAVTRFGDTNDDLIVTENETITKDDYFLITDESDTNGERKSYALRYRGADKLSSDNPVIKFDDLGSGEKLTRTLSGSTTTSLGNTEIAQIKIGGGIYRVYNSSLGNGHTGSNKDYGIMVDLDASGGLSADEGVSVNTKFGMDINITNSSLGVRVAFATTNSDDYDDLTPTTFIFELNGSSGEGRAVVSGDQTHSFRAPDDDDKNNYAYSTYGAFVRLSQPTSDPQEVWVEYPQNQRLPLIFITGEGASFSTVAAASTGAVSVQRIDVGATKLASEVSNINAVNSILVGGPCANAATASVMGNPADCTAGFEPGVGMLQMWDVGSGNIAMMVAGFAAADTRNAAAVAANYQDFNLVGSKMEVRKVGSSLTVAEPSAVVEEAEEVVEE